jgi:hypothetical protein
MSTSPSNESFDAGKPPDSRTPVRLSETFLISPHIAARVRSVVFYTPGLSQAALVEREIEEVVVGKGLA